MGIVVIVRTRETEGGRRRGHVVMSMSLLHCQGALPHHHREVGEGERERGACHHRRWDEEEGEGVLSVVFVVVACEGGRVRRVRMRHE